MAINSGMHGHVQPSLKLAEDFSTWWSGKAWTWKPHEVDNTRPGSTSTSVINQDLSNLKSANFQKEPKNQPLSSAGIVAASQAQITASIPPSKPFLGSAEVVPFAQSNFASNFQPPLHAVPPFFEIRRSATSGYGVFALQDIKPYVIILEEAPLLEASNAEFVEMFENLSLKDQDDFMSLACFDEISSDRRLAIFKTNRFYTSSAKNAVFRIACRFNHSCLPQVNYHWSRTRQVLVMSSKRFIRKGEEMFISYGQSPKMLLRHYGFLCSCGSCAPIEHQDQKPETWELEYWQRRTSCETIKDEIADWGAEAAAEKTVAMEDVKNIAAEWESEFIMDVVPKKEIGNTYNGW